MLNFPREFFNSWNQRLQLEKSTEAQFDTEKCQITEYNHFLHHLGTYSGFKARQIRGNTATTCDKQFKACTYPKRGYGSMYVKQLQTAKVFSVQLSVCTFTVHMSSFPKCYISISEIFKNNVFSILLRLYQ